MVLFEEISTLSNKAPHLFELIIHMVPTLVSVAGVNEHVKYQLCSWQSGQKNTSWIAPGGGGGVVNINLEIYFIYIYK